MVCVCNGFAAWGSFLHLRVKLQSLLFEACASTGIGRSITHSRMFQPDGKFTLPSSLFQAGEAAVWRAFVASDFLLPEIFHPSKSANGDPS